MIFFPRNQGTTHRAWRVRKPHSDLDPACPMAINMPNSKALARLVVDRGKAKEPPESHSRLKADPLLNCVAVPVGHNKPDHSV